MKKVFLLFAASALLFSCKKDNEKSGIFKGPDASVYHGKAWNWIKVTQDGVPEQMSLTLDQAALSTVSTSPSGGHEHEDHIIVPLADKAREVTPFQFILLDWNPNGHEPDGIYTLPHFDFHFYLTAPGEVMNYTDNAKLNADPNPAYLPANHIGGAPVPMMGKHWIDLASPELHGQPFTQTFLYGSYDQKIVFYEPMITLDFLKNTTSFERTIPQPAKVQKSGYYPTILRVVNQSGTTNIILDGFTYRQAS